MMGLGCIAETSSDDLRETYDYTLCTPQPRTRVREMEMDGSGKSACLSYFVSSDDILSGRGTLLLFSVPASDVFFSSLLLVLRSTTFIPHLAHISPALSFWFWGMQAHGKCLQVASPSPSGSRGPGVRAASSPVGGTAMRIVSSPPVLAEEVEHTPAQDVPTATITKDAPLPADASQPIVSSLAVTATGSTAMNDVVSPVSAAGPPGTSESTWDRKSSNMPSFRKSVLLENEHEASPVEQTRDTQEPNGVSSPSTVAVANASTVDAIPIHHDEEVLSVKEIEKSTSPLPPANEEESVLAAFTKEDAKALKVEDHEDQSSPSPDHAVLRTIKSTEQEPYLTQDNVNPNSLATPTVATASSARPLSAHAPTDPTDISKSTMSTAPISAIPPGLSRHTSSKSASPFRGNSPFRRDQSQTPGSESRSRPLSMVWGDWLRDKTRSVSRSGSRRGNSRPVSFALDKAESATSSSLAVGNSDLSLGDLGDVAVYSSSTTAPIAMPERTETWNSPDATLPPRTPETRELMLERLGILPSPAPTSATFESLGSRHRRRSSAARVGSSAGMDGLGLDVATVPSQESGESPVRPISTGLVGRSSPVRSATVGLRKVSEAEEVVVMRPRQQRKVSDLEMLPSEQKRLSLGQGLPRPDSLILLQSQVDLLAGVGQDAEHEDLENSMDDDAVLGAEEDNSPELLVQKSRTGTRNSSAQISADVWDDARSEVSAECGAVDETQLASTKAGTSRRSSVSSLGAPGTAAVVEKAVKDTTMSARAVSAGPTTLSPSAAVDIQPASEQKLHRRPTLDRPMSYMTLPRDEDGLPVPETITTASIQPTNATHSLQQIDSSGPLQQMNTATSLQPTTTLSSNESPIAADLSAMSGPPAGTTPFQQHPVLESSLVESDQRENANLPSSVVVDASVAEDKTINVGDTNMKRQSGFFGKQTPEEQSAFGGAPPPNRITDQHGLEDLAVSDDEVVPDMQLQPKARQPADKQNRRRSGLWDVLTTKRASSGAKLDTGGDFIVEASSAGGKAREDNTKRKLQKPQRASSSTVDLEPKKKRFSRLGSIFGRSDTTSHGPPKANKLTKMIPPNSGSARGTGTPRGDRPANSSTVPGNVQGYDEFEARRRRDLPAYQPTLPDMRPAAPSRAEEQPERTVNPTPTQPPPEGWYGPSAMQQPIQQPYFPPPDDPQPQFRRLHSQGRTSARPVVQLPPSFRPVEASFTAPVAPVGPPQDSRNLPTSMTSPVRMPDQGRNVAFNRQNSYESSYGSEFSGFSGQQVAGRAQQYPPSQSSVGPDASTIVTRAGAGPEQGRRVRSSGYEAARSPAKEYPDQQRPWAITIPPGQESTRSSRASSWGVAPEGTQYPGPSSDAPYYQQHQQYPPQQGYASNGSSRPTSRGQGQIPRSYTNDSYAPPYSSEPVQQYQQQYSNQPQMQHQYSYSQQQQHQYYSQPQQPRQQNRYYSQQAPPYQVSMPQQYNPRGHQRRTSSGYSGRRDDLTAGEEDLLMRGVSYPGQEWQPPGLGRSGWE